VSVVAGHPTGARHREQEPLLSEILNLLSNVLFPVVVFLIWSAATTIGTVVDQNQPPEHYYDKYPNAVANLVVRLHLTNVFHSVPYISLVVLLLVSMAVCTFRRVIPKRFPKDRAVPLKNFGLHDEVAARCDQSAAASQVVSFLRSHAFKVRAQTIDGAEWFFADKQKWARYGVLVAHVGFAVIAFGVFLGWLRGYSGQLMIYKGQTAAIPQAPLRLTLDNFGATFVPVRTQNGVTYQASKFESTVTFSDPGGSKRAHILVNHPFITSDRVYFYQASYAFGGRLEVLKNGSPVALPGTAGRLAAQDAIFLPGTSRVVQYGALLGPSDPSQTPPGVNLPAHDEYALWIFHDNIPTTAKPILLPIGRAVDAGDGYSIRALPPTPSSGLTYRYDPGQGWVGLGCIILVAGFVMALFFVPVKLYARVTSDGPAARVALAATTTKGNTIYEDDFKTLVQELQASLPKISSPAAREDHAQAYA